MVSSLANQLAQGASSNVAALLDRTKRKAVDSYLFTGRDAVHHELDTIQALGVNGLLQLRSLDVRLGAFEDPLFGPAGRDYDRTLRNAEDNARLDANIAEFLQLLGPYVLEASTGKVLEWLVRRFRIHEFNVDNVLALFLPYHETPHFAKMLSILRISDQSIHSYLLPTKSAALPLSRQNLVTTMLKYPDALRFVSGLLPSALQNGASHRTLVAFHTATLSEYITRSGQNNRNGMDEGVLTTVIASLLAPFTPSDTIAGSGSAKDSLLSSLLLLASLSKSIQLTSSALKAIIEAAVTGTSALPASQVVNALIAIFEPQDLLDKFTNKTVSALMRIENSSQCIVAAMSFVGSDKLICPMLPRAISQMSERHMALLETLIASSKTPTSIMKALCTHLLARSLQDTSLQDTSEGTAKDNNIRLLTSAYERHPAALQAAVADLVSSDPSIQASLDQLVMSLASSSLGKGGRSAKMDVILASVHADPSVRAIATRDIYKALSAWGDVDSEEVFALKSALRARLSDDSSAVLAALYAEPSQLAQISAEDPEVYISTIRGILHPEHGNAPRALVRSHIDFLSFHLLSSLPDDGANTETIIRKAFSEIYFPFLLLSNPRQKTSRVVWAAITDSQAQKGIGSHELVLGCADTYAWGIREFEDTQNVSLKKAEAAKDKDRDPQIKTLVKCNLNIAFRMAELIAISEAREEHTQMLLTSLRSPDTHARSLAALVLRSLLGQLSGPPQLATAHVILDVIGDADIGKMSGFLGGIDSLQVFLADEALGTAVVTKPNSSHTQDKLLAALLALIPLIPKPAGAILWISSPLKEERSQPAEYARLLRRVYVLSNGSVALPLLSANLLRALFISLGSDSLMFLCGMWCTSSASIEVGSQKERTAHAALSHAVAFLAAHQPQEGQLVPMLDFQTIVPALLSALRSESQLVREAAFECVVSIERIAKSGQLERVYAMDDIYGVNSSKLQFLEADLSRYLAALVSQRDHFVGSASYSITFHAEHLTKARGESKRDAGYKQRVLCWLLTHVVAAPVPALQAGILASMRHVSSMVKLQTLSDLLVSILDLDKAKLEATYGVDCDGFISDLVGCFDSSVSSLLKDEDGTAWSLFVRTFTKSIRPGFVSSAAQKITYAVEHGLYKNLSDEQKTEFCQLSLTLAREDDATYTIAKAILVKVLREEAVIIRLLQVTKPSNTDGTPRAVKRARTNSVEASNDADNRLSTLILLGEVLIATPLPASIKLVAALLETLSAVTQVSAVAEGETAYAQQLLMTVLEGAVTPLVAAQNAGSQIASIRLDILVDITRVTTNPQTFHQGLLLIAHIAPLARDSILHNLMPIFTFMGSNVFHRDDAYSFRVVQKTIESVIPVMLSSLKGIHKDKHQLWNSAKQFLHIFTDAANHVPRHRRTHFFTHLVDVLGPEDFLAPLCMLLVDKVANRVSRQSMDDAKATLALPLTILGKYSAVQQLTVMKDMSDEAIAHLKSHHGQVQPSFLGDISNAGTPSTSTSTPIRRAHALVVCVVSTAQQAPPAFFAQPDLSEDNVRSLISRLLEMAPATTNASQGESVTLGKAVQSTIQSTLAIVSAETFLNITLEMLNNNQDEVKQGALDLISIRISQVADDVRMKAKAAVTAIMSGIQEILSSAALADTIHAAFQALSAMIASSISGEESALLGTLDIVVRFTRASEQQELAMESMRLLTTKLGPRLIPHLHTIIEQCVAVMSNAESTEAASLSALRVLSSSLTAIPSFWGKGELLLVLQTYVHRRYSENLQAPLDTFIKSVCRKVPAKTLFITLCDAYTVLQVPGSEDAGERYVSFFHVVKRALHAAPRNEVHAQLRPLFKVFLDALERRRSITSVDDDEGEDCVVKAFVELVVKLNEATFRPLFRKMFDWAFSDDEKVFEKITFCRVYGAMLGYFEGLVISYMSFLLPPFKTILSSKPESAEQQALWVSTIKITGQSFTHDDGVFWRDDLLRQISSSLIAQVAVCVELGLSDHEVQLQECLSSLVDVTSDDALLKADNLALLMHTRAEDPRLRRYALQCSERVWRDHGSKLLGFVTESATFVAESIEDENDGVVEAAYKLRDAIEAVAGNLSQL